jgi:hypothetical protein
MAVWHIIDAKKDIICIRECSLQIWESEGMGNFHAGDGPAGMIIDRDDPDPETAQPTDNFPPYTAESDYADSFPENCLTDRRTPGNLHTFLSCAGDLVPSSGQHEQKEDGMFGDRCRVAGLFTWDTCNTDAVPGCGIDIDRLKPHAVLLDEAKGSFKDEIFINPGYQGNDDIRFSDVRPELSWRECEDLIAREERSQLPSGFGETLTAEEDLHRNNYLSRMISASVV